MTKTKLTFIGLAVALVGFLFAGSASAQDQTLTADPASVPEAGTYDITLTPGGFTAPATNLAVCDTGSSEVEWGQATLMQHCGGFGSPQDATSGAFTVEGVEIGEDGVTFLIFELVPDGQSAVVAVNIGMDDMTDDDMLADTGVETSVLVIIGAGIALAGLMVFGLSRRLRTL